VVALFAMGMPALVALIQVWLNRNNDVGGAAAVVVRSVR